MSELRKYGEPTTIRFPLIRAGVTDFATTTEYTAVAGDLQISKDEGTFANTTITTPSYEGNGQWSIALSATEMQAARIMLTIIDTATKVIDDQAIYIDTYGHPSAQVNLSDLSPLVITGIVSTGSTNTSVTSDLTEATNNHYSGRQMIFETGNLAGQATNITAYDGTTGTLTVDTLTEAPASTDVFKII